MGWCPACVASNKDMSPLTALPPGVGCLDAEKLWPKEQSSGPGRPLTPWGTQPRLPPPSSVHSAPRAAERSPHRPRAHFPKGLCSSLVCPPRSFVELEMLECTRLPACGRRLLITSCLGASPVFGGPCGPLAPRGQEPDALPGSLARACALLAPVDRLL